MSEPVTTRVRWPARHAPTLAGIALLIILYLAAGVRYAGFMTLPVFCNLIDFQAVLGLIAVGMTLVIISGGIDLSVGAVMGLASVMTAKLITDAGWPAWGAIAAALATGAAVGALQGAIIQVAGLGAFIVTLTGMFLARGIGFLISLESTAIADGGHARMAGLHWQLAQGASLRIGSIMMLAAVVIAAYVSRFSRFGRSIYALGGSEEASVLMGLAVPRVRVGVYALSGLCAALGGVALTFKLSSSGAASESVGVELDAIAAVVIGGALLSGGSGGVLGTLVGVLIISLILTVVTTYESGLNSGLTHVLVGGLLLAFVLLQKMLVRLAGAGTRAGVPL